MCVDPWSSDTGISVNSSGICRWKALGTCIYKAPQNGGDTLRVSAGLLLGFLFIIPCSVKAARLESLKKSDLPLSN